MKKYEKKFKANSSGQLLIVAALAIAILISSTTVYVYELARETSSPAPSVSTFMLALKQSARNTMISSLVNVSNGGENETLTVSLSELSSVIANQSRSGIWNLIFAPLNSSPYQSGIWLSWGSDGLGISSAYANFSLDFSGIQANAELQFSVNITTSLNVEGVFSSNEADKHVNVTCRVFNEGEPALAKNFTLFYEGETGEWIPVNSSHSLFLIDYGNGTYLMSFTAQIPGNTVRVLVYVHDLRDIFVRADTTCDEI